MSLFTLSPKQKQSLPILVLWLGMGLMGQVEAQVTNQLTLPSLPPTSAVTNTPPVNPATIPAPGATMPSTLDLTPSPQSAVPSPKAANAEPIDPTSFESTATIVSDPLLSTVTPILAALFAFASIAGFLLYQSGLTRAKNCGHAATVLLVGLLFGIVGYWMGGFAVEIGGVGDAHAALSTSMSEADKLSLDHELGLIIGGHHWGFMGSAGFFLASDANAAETTQTLFLGQVALLTIMLAATLGAALERGRIVALAIGAFVIGALIFPLPANWVWGGGWLAELGREFGLGHGLVDWTGAGAVHEAAGTLAFILALKLGPRYGRFKKEKAAREIPGHHMPFAILGALILLLSWTGINAFAHGASAPAAVHTLLAAAGGLVITFLLAGWRRVRPTPALLCRGLLGGAVASCGSGALVDPWAAFLIGAIAALLVQATFAFLERRRIDDPVGAAAVHGAGGAWGLIATGLFANGTLGNGLNGIKTPVTGLFYGGHGSQLAAQFLGVVTCFVVVFVLGLACFTIVQKIVGLRVHLEDETEGLDWPQTGAFGYQGDIEPEKTSPSGG